MYTDILKIYDEEYYVDWVYYPAHGNNWSEPWTPECVDITSIDGHPANRYTFHTIKTLEALALERTKELKEDSKIDADT